MSHFFTQQLHYFLDFGPAFVLAVFLGGVIGWERYRRHRAPTVTTFIILAAASCMAVKGAIIYMNGAQISDWNLPASVLTGTGFTGAAFIIWRENSLEGVTTGMTVFFTAVVGVTVGLGLYSPAVFATFFTLGAMAFAAKRWPGTDGVDDKTRRPRILDLLKRPRQERAELEE